MGLKRRTKGQTIAGYIAAAPTSLQEDLKALHKIIKDAAPKLHREISSGGVLGYGPFHYRYPSGREGDTYRILLTCKESGFSLHCLAVNSAGYLVEQFASRFPKANLGRSCVRFKHLEDLDPGALKDLIQQTAASSWA